MGHILVAMAYRATWPKIVSQDLTSFKMASIIIILASKNELVK